MKEKITKVFISGCTSRKGKILVDLINQNPDWKICGGFGLGEHQYDFPVCEGGNFRAATIFTTQCPNIIIDCSTPILSEFVYNSFARYYAVPMFCATANLSRELIVQMKQQQIIPVFQDYNLAYINEVITAAKFLLTQPAGYYNKVAK